MFSILNVNKALKLHLFFEIFHGQKITRKNQMQFYSMKALIKNLVSKIQNKSNCEKIKKLKMIHIRIKI
jgi:hypothetical protein